MRLYFFSPRGIVGLFAIAVAVYPLWIWAHGAERGLVMLLPTGYYQFGAALAVALSFLILAGMPNKLTDKASIQLENPFIWTLWWVGFTIFQCLVGNLWGRWNPWVWPLALIGKCRPSYQPLLSLHPTVGYTPAIALFIGFAWFELVDLAPEDPRRLSQVVLGYWLFTLAACLAFGQKAWFKYGEPFSIFFRLIGNCAFISRMPGADRKKIIFHLPGRRCLIHPVLIPSGVLFVLLTLSTVSFDGFSKTFLWLAAIDVNPLEFPGRSAVVLSNTAGLFLAFVLLAGIYYLTVFLGCVFAGQPARFHHACGRLVYSIIPISLVFHCAHYLTLLLVNSQ